MEAPRPLSRQRPDGFTARWTLTVPEEAYHGAAPFLIDDETPRDERVPRERHHANGALGIHTVTIAVPPDRQAEVEGWYRQVLGAPGTLVASDELRAAGMRFMVGPHAIELMAPTDPSSPLGQWVERRGASPHAATLRGAGARGPLDPARALGARLALV
jgi:hypothetical protein